jgi:TIR domain
MKVFLSWSGEKSRAVAEALRQWLPYINSEIQPWMSGTDIDPGARWSGEVAKELEATNFGIIFVTRDNQMASWLNFEAGAIAKQLDSSRVVPFAIDLKPSDVKQPLGQFQGKEMTKDGILAVLKLLNELCSHRVPDVAKALDQWWPDLEPKLEAASTSTETVPVRDQQDLLEEILTIVRGLQGHVGEPIAARPPAMESADERQRKVRALILRKAEDAARRIRPLLPANAEISLGPEGALDLLVWTPQELPDEVQDEVREVAEKTQRATVEFVFED